jgi:hypothetical protein
MKKLKNACKLDPLFKIYPKMANPIGIVYSLESRDGRGKIFIGSTYYLSMRKAQHKNACTDPQHLDYWQPHNINIREGGGWENFRVWVLESLPYVQSLSTLENLYALQRRETFHRQAHKISN